MEILAVIPSRYDSTRLRGKPLAMIGDRSMVQRVYEATKKCPHFSKVVVATDSELVADRVAKFGGEVQITSVDHKSGTDRVAEVAQLYPEMDVVVNVQGDQPFVTVQMLTDLVNPYLQGEFPVMTTLACPLNLTVDYRNPNTVKVLCDRHHNALYFSRAPIPYFRNSGNAPAYHHLGLYGFTRDFLAQYTKLSPSPLEKCEALEQLRVLENGFKIRVCLTKETVMEVNTPDDLIQANRIVKKI